MLDRLEGIGTCSPGSQNPSVEVPRGDSAAPGKSRKPLKPHLIAIAVTIVLMAIMAIRATMATMAIPVLIVIKSFGKVGIYDTATR